MMQLIRIKKGLNLKLEGEAVKNIRSLPSVETFALKPSDFTGVVPKLLVREGDEILAGTPLFIDKRNPEIQFCSPVSGEVAEVVRGDKRAILEIRILADKNNRYREINATRLATLDGEELKAVLLSSGVWPFIRQRPFAVIADPKKKPKSIFVSAFDTSPLAPDYNLAIDTCKEDFLTGLQALKKLTDGKLYLNIHDKLTTSEVFRQVGNAAVTMFSGPHPCGNAGVQIHHLDPVNKGEVVWYVNPQDVAIIGRLFTKGRFDATRVIALTGSQVVKPTHYEVITGTSIKHLLEDGGLKPGDNRIISGNLLSGTRIDESSYLGFYDSQITVIPEGNKPEFMGWIAPGLQKLSMSRAFFSWLMPSKKYTPDTNLHGEERPFVVTGEYEKVLPMDIYPVQLLKSIIIEDIELMENLGIYEVAEEDFALCEFVCTSKIESQQIIRKGLDLVRKELS